MVYTITWSIENYSYCLEKNGEALYSPEFYVHGLQKTAWRIGLHPRGGDFKNKGFVSVFLKRMEIDDGPEEISLRYELSFLAAHGSEDLSKEFECTFQNGHTFGHVSFTHMRELIKDHRDTFLPEDILSVRCKIPFGDWDIYQEVKWFARSIIATEHVSFLKVFYRFNLLKHNNRIFKFRRSKKAGVLKACLKLDYVSSCDGMLSVEIALTNTKKIISACKIYLLGKTGSKTKCAVEDNRYDDERKEISRLTLSLTKEEILDRKEELCPNDKLILLFKCVLSNGVKYENIHKIKEYLRLS